MVSIETDLGGLKLGVHGTIRPQRTNRRRHGRLPITKNENRTRINTGFILHNS